MTSSPASTVASSELYPNSEPVGQEPQMERMRSPFGSTHRPSRSDPESQETERDFFAGPGIGSKDLDDPQRPRAAGMDEANPILGSTTDAAETSGGNFIRTGHKRKRDADTEYPRSSGHGEPAFTNLGDPLPYPSRIAGAPSLSYSRGNNDIGASRDERSSKKRVWSDDVAHGPTARVQYSSQLPALPIAIWQRIFCFVPPVFLGRLLRVNRAFNTCLTAGDANQQYPKPLHPGDSRTLKPDAIWAASRKRFCPGLPKPIRGLLELEMWRLLRGRHCQLCREAKDPSSVISSESPWELGPGENGVRVIWPWGVRLCGRCILGRSEMEVNLLFSPDSSLLPGLPFAFVSSSNHYVTSVLLRSVTSPSTLQLSKRYYKAHIDEIRNRLNDARELGKPSAEEWSKGLEMEGKERHEDVVRWEQWEAKGGLKKVNQPPQIKPIGVGGSASMGIKPGSRIRLPPKPIVDADAPAIITPVAPPNVSRSLPCKSTHVDGDRRIFISEPSTLASFQPSWITSAAYPENIPQRHPVQFQSRPERSIREVNEAKAIRRQEIERRCAALDSPLLPNVLVHMEAFQAAIQISQPLNDQAWHVLKPRLLTQREFAERRESDRAAQHELLQAEHKQRRLQEAQLKETRETLDREWESTQVPIRTQITRLAEERIESKWANGKGVTKDNCPKFAADVLLYVRQKFYDEIAQDDEATIPVSETTKVDSGDRSNGRILILENMKWLFDSQIKPLTENFQKELFLCNGCDGNSKFYGLESVVQHYAAKHTTSLSHGNQVVHWRAEWPEHPPFHPEPSVAKAAYYKIPTPLITSLQGPPNRDPELLNHYGGFGQRAPQEISGMPRFPSEPYKGPYKDLYVDQQEQQNRNYSPSLAPEYPYFSATEAQSQSSYSNPNFGHVHPSTQISHNGVMHNHGIPSSAPDFVSQNYNPQFPMSTFTESSEAPDPKNLNWYSSEPPGGQYMPVPMIPRYPNLPLRPTNSQIPYTESAQIEQAVEMYRHQVEEMARHARDVWSATSGIKNIPQSVRIFVVIRETIYRFKAKFMNEPNLAMFIDGLDKNGLMRPIKSLKGLACKTCVTSGGATGAGQFSYPQLPVGYRSLHTLPELLNHFKTAHVESSRQPYGNLSSIRSPGMDWKFDMIELPESQLIADLINASGMDDTKLELLAKIFPEAFPSPLPRLLTAGNAGPIPLYTEGLDTRGRSLQVVMPDGYPASPSRPDYQYENQPISRPYSTFREPSQRTRSSEPPGEDEYDPHRPADLGKIVPSGLPSTHSRKSVRTSSTIDGQLVKSASSHQNLLHTSSDVAEVLRPSRKVDSLPTFAGDEGSRQRKQQEEGSHHSLSVDAVIETVPEDRYDDRIHDHRTQKSHGDGEEGNNHTPSAAYSLSSEENDLRVNLVSVKPEERALSPQEGASAADEFLDNLASASNMSHARDYTPADREENISAIKPKESSPERQWHRHNEVASEERGGRIGSSHRQQQRETEIPSVPSRENSIKSNYNDRQQSLNEHNYDENSRSRSHMHRYANGRKMGRSTEMYSSFEAPPGTIIREHYEMGGDIMETSHIGESAFRPMRSSRYRSRSRSPRPIPIGTTYYRTRSPGGRMFEPVYHVRSPQERSDIRPQRIISYEQPMEDHYDYIDQHRPPDRQYRHRYEYVPVRMGEHASVEPSRFVIAQSPDLRPPLDYVRLKRDYDGERMYEHHGQLYHTDSRPYHTQSNHGPLTSTPSYRY